MVSRTSARPSGPFVAVPAKMTSSILPPRRVFAPCSPMTQASASTTLLLPEPFGPTTQVTPCSNAKVVVVAKDLKPLSVRLLRYTTLLFSLRQRVALRYPNRAHRPARHDICHGEVVSRAMGITEATRPALGHDNKPRHQPGG